MSLNGQLFIHFIGCKLQIVQLSQEDGHRQPASQPVVLTCIYLLEIFYRERRAMIRIYVEVYSRKSSSSSSSVTCMISIEDSFLSWTERVSTVSQTQIELYQYILSYQILKEDQHLPYVIGFEKEYSEKRGIRQAALVLGTYVHQHRMYVRVCVHAVRSVLESEKKTSLLSKCYAV